MSEGEGPDCSERANSTHAIDPNGPSEPATVTEESKPAGKTASESKPAKRVKSRNARSRQFPFSATGRPPLKAFHRTAAFLSRAAMTRHRRPNASAIGWVCCNEKNVARHVRVWPLSSAALLTGPSFAVESGVENPAWPELLTPHADLPYFQLDFPSLPPLEV